jgi:hypothetical protein
LRFCELDSDFFTHQKASACIPTTMCDAKADLKVCYPFVQSSLNCLLHHGRKDVEFYSIDLRWGRLGTVHIRFPHELLDCSITSHSSLRFLERVMLTCLRRRSSRSRNDQSRVETRVTRGSSSWVSSNIPPSGLAKDFTFSNA